MNNMLRVQGPGKGAGTSQWKCLRRLLHRMHKIRGLRESRPVHTAPGSAAECILPSKRRKEHLLVANYTLCKAQKGPSQTTRLLSGIFNYLCLHIYLPSSRPLSLTCYGGRLGMSGWLFNIVKKRGAIGYLRLKKKSNKAYESPPPRARLLTPFTEHCMSNKQLNAAHFSFAEWESNKTSKRSVYWITHFNEGLFLHPLIPENTFNLWIFVLIYTQTELFFY